MSYEFPFNTFPLVNRVRITNPTANLDARYGPWPSTLSALSAFDPVLREKGLTVGIIENGSVAEYWYKNGITDSDLVLKLTDPILTTTVQNNSANWNFGYDVATYVQANSADWEESAEILPTVTNYLSTNLVQISALNVSENILTNQLSVSSRTILSDQLYYTTDNKVTQLSALSGNYDEEQFIGRTKLSQNNTRLINVGENWTPKDSNRNWRSVAMSSDGKYQTAVSSIGQIYTSFDYGNTWTPKDSNRDWEGIAISSDGKYQTATSFIGQIYISSDYGNTWTPKESVRNWREIAMSSDGKYQTTAASNNQIYVSLDYGNTWTPKDSNRNWLGIAMSSDGKYQTATVTFNGQIYTSIADELIDGGLTITGLLSTSGGTSNQWNSAFTTVQNTSADWEESAEILPTVTNYLSTNNVLISGATITTNLTVGGTIFSTASADVLGKYTEIIGSGTNFTINHNLSTTEVQVQVYKISDGTLSYPTIEVTSVNAIAVKFAQTIPTASYRVIVHGSIPSTRITAYAQTFYFLATGLGVLPELSASWQASTTVVQNNSAIWVPEDLALVYAVAL